LARWVKGRPLAVDDILTGAIRTYGADSLITDSAPGATAYATGHKGTDKALSIGAYRRTVGSAKDEPNLAYVPRVTLLEGAKVHGYATGLVATSNIQHATPAAFSAHVVNREAYDEIAKQQVYQGIDVVLSGGTRYLLPTGRTDGTRDDGEDLTATLKAQGYQFVTTKTDLLKAVPGKLWGLFAPNDLAFEIERQRFTPEQPSLADMTERAIVQLEQSPQGQKQGFFLFVEGSKVDWAAHNNDPVGVLSELLAFDDAVGKALSYAKTNPFTQVIVVADHATGGLSLGTSSDPAYSRTDEDEVVVPLRKAKVTSLGLSRILSTLGTNESIRSTLAREWGIANLSDTEQQELKTLLKQKQNTLPALSRIISTRARVGWTSTGHTGADVYLFAFGPAHPYGLVENTAIGRGIAQYLDLSLPDLQVRLFVDLSTELRQAGYVVALDRSDAANGKLVVSKGNRKAYLPWAKNQLIIEQRVIPLEGIVVFSENLNRVFGPATVLTLLRQELP
jgi:alkaline phosphatase